jgi:DNA-binding LacI/PurR family transcriptional regulator
VTRSSILDVARLAGVSPATASHALNGKGRVNAATQARILAAADQLGYRANPSAVSLRTGRSSVLAIQVGRLGTKGVLLPSASYFNAILNGISAEALGQGWMPVFLPRDVTREDVRRLNPDCGIIVDPQGDESLLTVLSELRRPILTTGRVVGIAQTRDLLTVDNDAVAAVTSALDHLAAAGYRRPALVTSLSKASYVLDARQAAVQWGESRGATLAVFGLDHGEPKTLGREICELLKSSDAPDAIYATDEAGALGALKASRKLGVDVPQDLGIVCGIDGPMLSEAWPPITAVDVRPALVGERAAHNLLERMRTGVDPSQPNTVPFVMRKRRSTARAR